MIDAAPCDVRDVQQTVDATEIDERAVIGDVLDGAVDLLALFELADDFRALLGAALFENRTARHDDIAAAAIPSSGFRTGCGTFISGATSRIGRISTCERGRKATAAVEVDGEATLDLMKMTPFDAFLLLEGLFELDPSSLRRRALSRK